MRASLCTAQKAGASFASCQCLPCPPLTCTEAESSTVLLCVTLQGDSWTIAFHDAEDAVAFSLQVNLHWVLAWLSMRLCSDPFHQGAACCERSSTQKSRHSCILFQTQRAFFPPCNCCRLRSPNMASLPGHLNVQVQQALGDKVWEHRHLALIEGSIRQQGGSHTAETSDLSVSSSYAMIGSGTPSPLLSMVTAAGGSQTDTQPQVPGRLHGSFSAASDDPGDHGSSCGRGSSSLGFRSRDCSFTAAPGQVLARGDVELGVLPASTSASGNTTQAQGTGLCSQGQGPARLGADLQQQRKTPQQQLRSRLEPDGDDDLLGHHDTQQQQPQHRWGARKLTQSFRQAAKPEASPSAAAAAAAQAQEGHRLQLGSWIAGTGVSQHSGTVSTVQSSRPSSRLYSAGSALMHRLSRAVRSNFSSAILQPAGSDHGIQELRLSVRIGIATGWLTYGATLDNSKIKERAKSKYG